MTHARDAESIATSRGVSQMQRQLAAIVLGLLAHVAMAQCVAPQATSTQAGTTMSQAPATARRAPELIKTAAAGTRDDAPPSMHAGPRNQGGQDHPRRGGTAMLLAALALMSGI